MKRTIAVAIAWLFVWIAMLSAQSGRVNQDSIADKIDESWQLLFEDQAKAYDLAQQILTFSEKNQYLEGEAESKAILGVYTMHLGDWTKATDLLNQSFNIWKELGNNEKAGNVALKLTAVQNWQGNYDAAFDYLQQASQLLKETSGSLKAYENLIKANQFMDTDDILAAKDGYLSALQIFKQASDSLGIAIANYELGNLNYRQNNIEQAIGYISESLLYFQAENNTYYLALANSVLGGIYLEQDKYELAKQAFRECFRLGKEMGASFLQHDAYINLSVVAYYEGKYEEAVALADSSALYLKESGGLPDKKYLYEHYSDIYRAMGKHKLANQYLDSVIYLNGLMFNEDVAKAKEQLLTGNGDILDKLEEYQKENLELQERISASQQRELRRQALLGLTSVSTLLLLFILGISVRLRRQQKKSNLLVMQQREMRHQHEIKNIIQESKDGVTQAYLEGQEKERNRIAAILHDRLGSQLAAIRWSLEANIDEQTSSIAVQPVESTLKALEDTHKDLRRIVRDLERTDFNLKKRLEEFLNKIQATQKIKTELNTFGLDDDLPLNLTEFVFDILLQLIANILEHAQANSLSVEINQIDDELSLLIEDDGVGFQKENVVPKDLKGNGLKNVESRVLEKNGSFLIDSKPGKGTTIDIVIPI